MKMKIFNYILCFGFISIYGGCKKENNNLNIPDIPRLYYSLPQGQHSYDNDIVSFYDTYGSYILYKFTQRDYTYSLTEALDMSKSYSYKLIETADEASVPAALDFIQQYWLGFYPEEFKKEYLPFKILLAGRMCAITTNTTTGKQDTAFANYARDTMVLIGSDHLTFANIDANFSSITLANKLKLKKYIHARFFQFQFYPRMGESGNRLTPPADFFNSGAPAPSSATLKITDANKYDYGYIMTATYARDITQAADINSYIEAICGNTEASLTGAGGLFDRSDPVKSKYAVKKYDVLIKYFKENYNIDLNAIGNKQD